MNENFIKDLHIQNFKSIKDLKLDCKRINLFIGKPNVGKSNILEGVSLLAEDFYFNDDFKKFIRYDKIHNLFFESETNKPIKIMSNNDITYFLYNNTEKLFFLIESTLGSVQNNFIDGKKIRFDSKFNSFFTELIKYIIFGSKISKETYPDFLKSFRLNMAKLLSDKVKISQNEMELSSLLSLKSYNNSGKFIEEYSSVLYSKEIKFYKFLENPQTTVYDFDDLIWPNGNNIISVLERNKSLRLQVGEIFKEYGYSLLIDKTTGEIGIQKSQDGIVFRLPLDFVADTLKRFIFHLAAIKSNENSVLIFEEPEAHCFPQYISIIAEEIVKSESNQFFIATHSPYILNDILEKADREDVAVHLTYFENYETKVKTLSSQELSELADYGVDIFFNIENYLPHAN